jgi:hypothetical protein
LGARVERGEADAYTHAHPVAEWLSNRLSDSHASANSLSSQAAYDCRMRGDRVEAVVDTGQGTQTFVIEATRAGRRLEVTTSRGVVEVSEVTRGGTPVRTGRFMASRLIALVEHPAHEGRETKVDVQTRRRLTTGLEG